LVKEMRLKKISTREQANTFLERYLPRYNERFKRVARKEGDLHRPFPEEVNLREIFCIKGNRTINDGYIIKWRRRVFILDNPSIALRRRKAEVREHFDGRMTIKFKDRYLDYHEVYETQPINRHLIIHGISTDIKVWLTDVRTGNYCMAENRKFLHGIDTLSIQFDTPLINYYPIAK